MVTATPHGPMGHALGGEDSFAFFADASLRSWRTARADARCRIAVFRSLPGPRP